MIHAFPMPNMLIKNMIVVASVYYTDEVATVLVLNPQAPYFTVGQYDMVYGTWHPLVTVENIVPAVREYEQMGGDY